MSVSTHAVDLDLQLATKTREKLAPRLWALESSDTQGGTMELMKPIPMPAMMRAQMNMLELVLADMRAAPRMQNIEPTQTPFLRPNLSPHQPPMKHPHMAPK